MKRFLSLALVLVLVFGAIMPSFAEVTDPAVLDETNDLVTYGIIEGDGTSFNEDQPLTRAAMAKILAYFNGEAEAAEAYALTEVFSDVTDEEIWYYGWVSYAGVKGWMVGDTGVGGTFRPNDNMNAQEVNQLMIRVLGYDDVAWADVNAKAEELGVAVSAADNSLVLRGESFKAIRNVLDATPVDGEMTLGAKLVADGAIVGYEAPVAPVTELAVGSVEAPNARQVKIMFNQNIDAASVTSSTVKVYIGGASSTTSWTSTVKDNMVTLGLSSDVAQDTAVKVVVDGVTAGELKVEDYETTITMKDLVNPVILNVNATTSKTFVIETSEPIKIETAEESYHVMSKVKVDDLALVGKFTQDLDANTLTVELGTKLAVGEHTIKVTGVKDIVGFKAADFTGTITVIEDVTAPVVTGVEFVDIDTIKVMFNEPVASAGTLTVDGNGTTLGTLSADKKVQTVNLGTSLGLASLIKATLSYVGTTDLEGNTVATAQTFAFVAEDDLVAPTATVSVTSANKVKVVFSETVSAPGTLTVKNAAGATVAVGALVIDATDTTSKTYVSANAIAATEGAYTVELKDSADNGVRANKIVTFSTSVTTNDITAPTIEEVVTKTAYAAGPPVVNGQAQIFFSEAMDATTATTLTNYMIDFDGAGGNAAVQLSSITGGAAALSANGKVVTLTIPGSTYLADTTTVAVLAVKDAAGNLIATADFNNATVIDSSAPGLLESGFELVAQNKIKVTYNNPLVSIDPSNFVVQAGSTTAPATALPSLVGVAYSLDATDKILTITLSGNLTVDGMLTDDDERAELVITAGNTKDIYGTASEQVAIDVVDKIVPTASLAAVTSGSALTINFSEDMAIDANAFAAALNLNAYGSGDATPQFMVFVDDVQVAVTSYIAADTDELTITLASGVVPGDVVEVRYTKGTAANSAHYLEDLSANLLANFVLTDTVE